jgi:hypothetical protein
MARLDIWGSRKNLARNALDHKMIRSQLPATVQNHLDIQNDMTMNMTRGKQVWQRKVGEIMERWSR